MIRRPTRDGVLAAAASIAQILPPTPLLPVEIDGTRCWVKAESLQPIGAFKIRGGWWRLSNLSHEESARGVVAVSSGNHAQGVAWAARGTWVELSSLRRSLTVEGCRWSLWLWVMTMTSAFGSFETTTL